MKKIIRIANLDCAGCAAELQEELEKIKGVEEVSVDFVGQRVDLTCTAQEGLDKALYTISHFEEVKIVDGNAPRKKESRLKEILSIAISVVFFAPALVLELLAENEWAVLGLYLGAFVAAGWSVVWSVAKNCVKAFRGGFHFGILLDENLLMLIAAAGAFALGQNMEGAIVMLLYQIGELLQSIAVGSSRGAIEKLMELKSDSAILLEGESRREVPPEELKEGDLILLRKGDKLPADCMLCEGSTALDTKSITGESYLREVSAGEEMLAGCVNEGSAVKARVLRPTSESAVAKILALVENSTAKKAKPEKFITRFARIYTPVVVLIALIVAVLPPMIVDLHSGAVWSAWVGRALNFLVISCPCALIISVPLTYFSGVGSLARCGVLVKGAVYLDALAKVKTAAFDKTGTLTEGKFSVSKVNGERAFALAAAVEKNSSHPLAQAFAGAETPFLATETEEISGMGLSAVVEGKPVLVGSERLMREKGIPFEPVRTLSSVVYVAEDGKFVGSVEIEDKLKADAKESLSALKETGISRIAVLTGDTEERARAVLKELPVDEICAGLLPDQKPERAKKLKETGALLYVGDGINDTPVMAESDVSASMGALGSDAAIEASDLVLASDSLSALPKAVKGAKKTGKIVAENIVFSIAVKVALMALSLFGLIPLWAAVLGDVGVMLLAVLNSMRMRARIR
ncbi:MAG: heavy metal translocating P-type ATPase [Candidatus Gallimonas sp.]